MNIRYPIYEGVYRILTKYGKFSLILFYDNEYNNAHGEDL